MAPTIRPRIPIEPGQVVMVGLVPTIHPTASSLGWGWMDPRDKPEGTDPPAKSGIFSALPSPFSGGSTSLHTARLEREQRRQRLPDVGRRPQRQIPLTSVELAGWSPQRPSQEAHLPGVTTPATSPATSLSRRGMSSRRTRGVDGGLDHWAGLVISPVTWGRDVPNNS